MAQRLVAQVEMSVSRICDQMAVTMIKATPSLSILVMVTAILKANLAQPRLVAHRLSILYGTFDLMVLKTVMQSARCHWILEKVTVIVLSRLVVVLARLVDALGLLQPSI